MKIALIENKSSEFYNSRLRYAQFLKEKGHDVTAIIPDDEFHQKIAETGISVISLGFDVRQRSLKTVRAYYIALKRIFQIEKFDVLHFYRLQPNLLGTRVAYYHSRDSKIINHITGLGLAFAQDSFKYKILRQITKMGYQLNDSKFNARLIFQNEEDKIELGNRSSYAVVTGSAVNEDRFHPMAKAPDTLLEELETKVQIAPNRINILFVSRLVKIKGLGYLVEAVKKYNQFAVQKINLLAAGWIDTQNPDSFTEKDIEKFSQVEGVHFLGKRSDIPELLAFSDIAVLPTFYREGTPRFMLEAMAMKKPIITTDMPGCNHLIPADKNGKLIQPRSVEEIVNALRWMGQKNLDELGEESYRIYQEQFSEQVVYNQLMGLYYT